MKEFLKRLRVPSTDRVSSQALEYCRLCEVKCPRRTFSSSCMAIICIELACSHLQVPLEKVGSLQHGILVDVNKLLAILQKQAHKMAGVKPKAYVQAYQTMEKLLKLSSGLGVQEMAIQFGCLEAVSVAKEVLSRHRQCLQKKYSEAQREGLDLHKPLYASAALYCSCKLVLVAIDMERQQLCGHNVM